MLLAVDIGNIQIHLGVFEGDTLRMNAHLSTDRSHTEEEDTLLLQGIFRLKGIDLKGITAGFSPGWFRLLQQAGVCLFYID